MADQQMADGQQGAPGHAEDTKYSIVAVGASAGGLKALKTFMANVPAAAWPT